MPVVTDVLQAVINAQAGDADVVVLSDVGRGLSSVGVGTHFEQIVQRVSGETSRPSSEFTLGTTALNLPLGRAGGVNFGRWNSNAAFFNDLFGSTVSTPAEFE